MGGGAARAGQPDDCVHRSGSIHSMSLSYTTMDLYGNGPGEQRIMAVSILCTARSMRFSTISTPYFVTDPSAVGNERGEVGNGAVEESPLGSAGI